MVLGLLCFEVVSPKPNTTIKNRKEKIKKKKKQITTIERESERSHLSRQWVYWLMVAAGSVISSSFIKAVFGWGENREDGKWREENRVENTVFHCLVGEGRKLGRKFSLLGPHFLSSQIGRKSWREKCCHSTFTDRRASCRERV